MLTAAEFRLACQRSLLFRDQRTRCPHCRAMLAPRTAIVIATGRCPVCGGRVLADPPDADGTAELIPAPEFKTAAERFNSIFFGIILVGMCGWVASLCSGILFVGPITPRAFSLPVGVLLAWSLVGPPAVAVLLIVALVRRAKWNESLACPWCGEANPLNAPTVNTTGCCPSCGRTMLDAEEPPPAAPATLLSVAEFAARLRRQTRANLRAWGLFFAVVLGLALPLYLPVAVLGRYEAEIRLTRQICEDEAYQLLEYGVLPATAVVMAAAIGPSRWYFVRVVRRAPLVCPHCAKTYTLPGLVLASRRCDQCRRVVVDEHSDQANRYGA